jgi:hypothetical protein
MTSTQNETEATSSASPFDQLTAINEQFVAAARKAGISYLGTYEKAVGRAIDFELKIADASKQQWLKSLVEAQTGLARDLTTTYASTARSLLK